MEMTEIIFAIVLGLIGTISLISSWVVKGIVADVKELEHAMNHCQTSLPKEYVLKDDHNREMREIKKMLGNIYDILRETKKK